MTGPTTPLECKSNVTNKKTLLSLYPTRFVDRDMFMRFLGTGIGHSSQHSIAEPVPVVGSCGGDSNDDENDDGAENTGQDGVDEDEDTLDDEDEDVDSEGDEEIGFDDDSDSDDLGYDDL